MAKKQQMRWTDEGAHCLAQVRVAVLNEEFSVKKLAVLTNYWLRVLSNRRNWLKATAGMGFARIARIG
jgi:hypothetical protein